MSLGHFAECEWLNEVVVSATAVCISTIVLTWPPVGRLIVPVSASCARGALLSSSRVM